MPVQAIAPIVQEPGMMTALWNWLFAGMGGIILYLANQVRGKASSRHVESIEEDLDKKVGKDQFIEFKEGNTALHKANGAKLDTVISQLNSRNSGG